METNLIDYLFVYKNEILTMNPYIKVTISTQKKESLAQFLILNMNVILKSYVNWTI